VPLFYFSKLWNGKSSPFLHDGHGLQKTLVAPISTAIYSCENITFFGCKAKEHTETSSETCGDIIIIHQEANKNQ
jgi:hypothetical protein